MHLANTCSWASLFQPLPPWIDQSWDCPVASEWWPGKFTLWMPQHAEGKRRLWITHSSLGHWSHITIQKYKPGWKESAFPKDEWPKTLCMTAWGSFYSAGFISVSAVHVLSFRIHIYWSCIKKLRQKVKTVLPNVTQKVLLALSSCILPHNVFIKIDNTSLFNTASITNIGIKNKK